jgi:hypothetical protein
MAEWQAALLVGFAMLLVQLFVAVYYYGGLSRDVKHVTSSVASLEKRTGNVETVIMGPGGHGERLAAIEAWRIEHRAKIDAK